MTVAQADPITVLKGPHRHRDAIHRGSAGAQVLDFELLPLAPAYAAVARGNGGIVDRSWLENRGQSRDGRRKGQKLRLPRARDPHQPRTECTLHCYPFYHNSYPVGHSLHDRIGFRGADGPAAGAGIPITQSLQRVARVARSGAWAGRMAHEVHCEWRTDEDLGGPL